MPSDLHFLLIFLIIFQSSIKWGPVNNYKSPGQVIYMLFGEIPISLEAQMCSTGGASVLVAGGVPLPRLRVAYPYLILSRREKTPVPLGTGVIVT